MNILVVDDEPAVRRVEIRVLEQAGHTCFGAGSCAEAMEVLGRENIDLTVTDVGMPGDNGIVLAKLIQRDHPGVTVIMVTATADFTSVSDARRAGAIDYLVKPVMPGELTGAIDRAAAIRHRRRSGVATAPVAPSVGPEFIARAAPGEPEIDSLFREMCAIGASDLHLSVSVPPMVRKDGGIMQLRKGAPPLSAEDVIRLLTPIVPGKNRKEFESRHDSDFAYEIDGLSRFRGNIFMDRRGMAAVFRIVPTRIVTVEELGLSRAVLDLCELRKGLVLVTGPTGSGKSTTLAAMIDYINRTRSDHIVTIEDPIEFVHSNQRCLIHQREVHTHTRSFKAALRAALREDPDVVLIGEMRDLETVSIALKTAETGHLVFGTLHTTTAASTVDRIIDQFPNARQSQVRVMLSESLKGVIAQTLCRRIGGGRVAALETLMVNTAISNLIREAKTFQIPAMMQVGRAAGNVSLNDALLQLIRSGQITADEGVSRADDKDGFTAMMSRAGTLR